MLQIIGSSADPWETPLITELHLDIEPLTATLFEAIQSILNPVSDAIYQIHLSSV